MATSLAVASIAALAGCAGPGHGDGAAHTGAGSACVGASSTQYATELGTHTTLEGCGDSFLGDVAILGDGDLELSLFTDGTELVPRIDARSDGAVLRGLRLHGTFELAGAEDPVLWRLPYDGRGRAGLAPLGTPDLDADGWPLTTDPDAHDTSWWAGLVARPDGGSLLIGGLSATETRLTVAFGADGSSWFAWGGEGEEIRLDDGDGVYLDPLFVTIGADPDALWADWASRALAAARAEPPARRPLVGVGTPPREPGALGRDEALAAASAVPPGLWLRLGDGWESPSGDWSPGAEFPDGLGPVATAARDGGGHAAAWLAPFSLDASSPVLAAHPEWAVGGATWDGRPALDTTVPDASAWLVGLVTARVGEGFEAVELGSGAAGAVEGRRGGPGTGIAAWRAALAAIRAAVGPDVRLLVADAPLLPSLGLVDGFRVGTGEAWPDDAATRAAAARDRAGLAPLAGTWWWNDPGPASTPAGLSAALASGGALTAGTDAAALLRPELVALAGSAVSAPGRLDPGEPAPTRIDGEGFVVLQDPGAAPVDVPGPGGTELWSGETAGAGTRTLQPGAAEVWTTP